jgi:hypothetical protein
MLLYEADPGCEMAKKIRTIQAEITKILDGLDVRIKMAYQGSTLATTGLAWLAFRKILENSETGVNLELTMREILEEQAKLPLPPKISKEYLQHALKACAHCVSAVLHERSGDEIQAWQQACDATAEAGVELAIFVSHAEKKHRASLVAANSGSARGKRNEKLREVVIEKWRANGQKRAKPGAREIAEKFRSDIGAPSHELRDFGSGLSLENLDKTFERWIGEELKNPISKKSGSQLKQ